MENNTDFQATPLENMSRGERRERERFFRKKLKEHEAKRPEIDITQEDKSLQQDKIMEVQRWATHTGILMRKIQELDEFKRSNKRNNK